MPASAAAGTWKPDPSQFGAFATALARRYDGHFPDPLQPGAFLPAGPLFPGLERAQSRRVSAPQWTSTGAWLRGEQPGHLPRASERVLRGGQGCLAVQLRGRRRDGPLRRCAGGERIPPVQFDRVLFCLAANAKLTPLSCPDPPHLDAVSHHPYGIGGPLWHALNADDAAVPDIYKIAGVLHAAIRDQSRPSARAQADLGDRDLVGQLAPRPQGVPIAATGALARAVPTSSGARA